VVGRYVSAVWRTLPLLFWTLVSPALLAAYVIVVFVPVIVVSVAAAFILPAGLRRSAGRWILTEWLPHCPAMVRWWCAHFCDCANRLWRCEFGHEIPFDRDQDAR